MVQTLDSAAQPGASGAPKPGENVVVVQKLNKVFKDFWMRSRVRAVNNVSFEIRRGEVFGLLGPNGSGKSTTIKILLGLLHKTSGLVSVFGKLPSDVVVKERIGYLPEESYLYPFLNARETLEYYAKLFGLDASIRKRRIDELLEMVGLTAVQHRPVREYSKGMQRRIGLAQALINDPELLILDEPTTGLDPIGTRQVKDLIVELARRGKTILLSSHLLGDVEDCVDRLVILYGGKIQAEGTCDELLEARDRTIIESESLDDATVAEIDAVIRRRSMGEKAVARVSRPRQRLEELFIDIVDRARAVNLETSGAQHGGTTAAFLKGDGASGDELIASLVAEGRKDEGHPSGGAAAAAQAQAQAREAAGADLSVVSDLLSEAPKPAPIAAPIPGSASARPAPASGASTAPSAKPPAPDADLGVIGSLLDGGTEPGPGRGATGPGPGGPS